MENASGAKRYITLDAMRGFAVMGILAMNIVGFAMPKMAYVTPLAYGGETAADQVTWFCSFVMIDGKLRGLFSLLFGASMMLVIERADAKGENAASVHYSRMIWLGLFGLTHYFFIWWGDILFLYASVGCIAFFFQKWEPEDLIKWALILFGCGFLWWSAQFGSLQLAQLLTNASNSTSGEIEQYRAMLANMNSRLDLADEVMLHRGAYWPITLARLTDWYFPVRLLQQSITETLPLMMIGMAMKKNGFLTGEWAKADYARWAIRLVPAGLLLTSALGGWMVMSGYDLITSLAVSISWSAIPRLMLTIGYAALLVMLVQRLAGGALIARVAAAGQAAFSNYLGTSIVMTTIFYGYGLGLYGDVSRLGLWAFVVGAWVVMLLWSKPWLERFRYGPLEWLWRSLARMEIQRMRR